MKRLISATLFFACMVQAGAQTGITNSQMAAADNIVKSFLSNYNIPGATMALAKDGKIVYLRGYGYSDINLTVPTQPHNLFRIASLSKQVTAIAIMKMMQDSLLSMNSKVFGPEGILKNHPVFSTAKITDTRIYRITVQQLLEHSAGWNRDLSCNPNPTDPYPWYFSGCDPITWPLRVTMLTGTTNPVSKEALIKYLLEKGLDFAPGTSYNYSNIGFLILGRVIEKLSGISYENYVQQNILTPLGIFDMHQAKNLLTDKQEREMEYAGNGYTTLSLYNTGALVPWEYGGFSVEAMDAHGGWIATARDMLKLLTAVDSFSTKPDILLPATIATMVSPSANFQYYAKGWSVNPYHNWWHTGSLDGTATEWVRSADGYTWVILLNKRVNSNSFWNAIDQLGWKVIAATSSWPTYDLMTTPTTNASNLFFTNKTETSVTVSWANGNGGNRMLLVKADNAVSAFPLDGTDYLADAAFGAGSNLGANVYVAYNGSGNSVAVTGLTAGKTYYYRVVEYNKNASSGNNSLYLLGANPVASLKQGATYTFTGSGNWNQTSNWSNNTIPPNPLTAGEIIINPPINGECRLNVPQTISIAAKITVAAGKKFTVMGNLKITK